MSLCLLIKKLINSSGDHSEDLSLVAVMYAPENREMISFRSFADTCNVLHHCIVFSSSLDKLTTKKSVLQICLWELFLSQSLNRSTTVIRWMLLTACYIPGLTEGVRAIMVRRNDRKQRYILLKTLMWKFSKMPFSESHSWMVEMAPSQLKIAVPFVNWLNNQLTLFNAYLSQQSTVNVGSFRLQA